MSTNTNIGRIILMSGLLLAGETAMSLEQPDYKVMHRDGDIEYRQYEPYLVAQTLIENVNEYNDAGNEGFRRLFRYITGGNTSQSKIEMTAPVQQSSSQKISMTVPVQQTVAGDNWRVAFMLPSDYSIDSAPVPTDSRITVAPVPGRLMAVLRYSGRWSQANYEEHKSELIAALNSAGIEQIGPVQSAVYNPPYMPPFLRRNEVMVEVNRMPAEVGTEFVTAQSAY